jgi:hypothetical protein
LENLKGRDHSEDLGVEGYSIRMDVREVGWEGVDRIHVAQDKDHWGLCEHGNIPLVSIKARNYLTS